MISGRRSHRGRPGRDQERVAVRRKRLSRSPPRSDGGVTLGSAASAPAGASAFHLTPVVLVGGNTLRSGGSHDNTACFHERRVGMGLLLKEEKPLMSGGQRAPPPAFSSPQKRFTMNAGVLRSSLEGDLPSQGLRCLLDDCFTWPSLLQMLELDLCSFTFESFLSFLT